MILKDIQIFLALCEKVITPLQSSICESFTSLWRNFGPLFFAELFQFSHAGLFSSMNGLCKVMPKHLNGI